MKEDLHKLTTAFVKVMEASSDKPSHEQSVPVHRTSEIDELKAEVASLKELLLQVLKKSEE